MHAVLELGARLDGGEEAEYLGLGLVELLVEADDDFRDGRKGRLVRDTADHLLDDGYRHSNVRNEHVRGLS